MALPRRSVRSGLVWGIARRVNARVVRQVSEADIGNSVVVVFKVAGSGRASIVFALTKGETPKAFAAATYNVHAR
jgi:hypothetical protein